MCSIGEDDYGDEGGAHAMIPNASDTISAKFSPEGECTKCSANGVLYKLSYREPECRECYLAYARHKFRSALGASKVLPRGAQVLLAVDGSAESLVLLDMLHYAQTQNTFKRLHCNAQVLYIDESVLASTHPEQDPISQLKALALRFEQFAFYALSIRVDVEEATKNLVKLKDYTPSNNMQLKRRFDNLHSLTSRQDYLRQLRKRLLARAALELGCGYVFEPSVSTQLAAQLLTAISLGRGGSAALDVALLDDRLSEGVKLLRPLRDLNEAEVQLYLQAQQMTAVSAAGTHGYGLEAGESASLHNLSQSFISNLQANFSGTVSTVFRTGNKITSNQQPKEREVDDKCVLCGSFLDYANSKTLLAIEFSRIVSDTAAVVLNEQSAELEKQALAQLNSSKDDTLTKLCHACRNIHKELSDKQEEL